MAKYIITNDAGQVLHRYEASEPEVFGHLWMPPIAQHVKVPAEIDLECAAMQDGQVVSDPALEAAKAERQWESLRAQRNSKLTACDWTQLGDSPLDAAGKANWATYRQALRDLPQNTIDPANVVWPVEPET